MVAESVLSTKLACYSTGTTSARNAWAHERACFFTSWYLRSATALGHGALSSGFPAPRQHQPCFAQQLIPHPTYAALSLAAQ